MSEIVVRCILFYGGILEVILSSLHDDKDRRFHYTIMGLAFMMLGICRLL